MTLRFVNLSAGRRFAFATCDSCNRQLTISAGPQSTVRDMRRLARRLAAHGWQMCGGPDDPDRKHRCPACARRARATSPQTPEQQKDSEQMASKPMATKSTPALAGASEQPLRQPTQDQRGDIIEMLVTCYDRKAKRYTGAETDKTVADTIGGGCLPGWVTEIRERDFGPSGGNEEIEAIRAEIAALSARLDRVCAAVGPRAR